MCVSVCVCVCVCVCLGMCVHVCVCMCVWIVRTHVCACKHVFEHLCEFMCVISEAGRQNNMRHGHGHIPSDRQSYNSNCIKQIIRKKITDFWERQNLICDQMKHNSSCYFFTNQLHNLERKWGRCRLTWKGPLVLHTTEAKLMPSVPHFRYLTFSSSERFITFQCQCKQIVILILMLIFCQQFFFMSLNPSAHLDARK